MSYNRAEYDTEALRHNFNVVRELVGDRKIMAAVKANGYGLGVMPMVNTLMEEGVDYLAVALADEALALRAKEIATPILVLGAIPPQDLAKVIYNDIAITIFSFDCAMMTDFIAGQMGKRAKVHIKLDTGMHRLGFVPTEENLGMIKVICEMPNIEVEGIFSHLSQADCDSEYTEKQMAVFKTAVERLAAAGVDIPLKHLANSAAILDYPDSYWDMVRPGILLHGFGTGSPNSQKLKEVMSLKSAIVRIHKAPEGSEVSYGGTFVASEPRRIATVPIGYADGYFRCLSNKAEALVGGKRVKQVGNICMDQLMLDITDVPNVNIGDEVVLWGRQGEEFISLEEVAAKAGTITYEILTSIKRVPKYYYFEDDD
ncbi:MAG: alanine racemase [Bacillota bacterium]|nr:alanine racemase [Bacillota bacterium]